MSEKNRLYSRPGFLRKALILVLVSLICVRILDKVIYPGVELISPDFFFAACIASLFFLWFDVVKEKEHIGLIQKQKDAISQLEAKYTVAISNEMMVPVTMIMEWTEFIKGIMSASPEDKEKYMLKNVENYLERLLNSKYNLTRAGIGMPFEKSLQPFSLKIIAQATVDEIKPFLDMRKQRLSIHIAQNMPDILINTNSINDALAVLLLSSARVTPENGEISLKIKEEKNNVRIVLENGWQGVTKEMADSVFKDLYESSEDKSHAAKEVPMKLKKMYIGLKITKNIIDSHRGKIWMEPDHASRSKFIVTLPKLCEKDTLII